MKRFLPFLVAVAALAQTATVVIVPEALVPAANALAAQHFDSIGGSNTFTSPVVIAGTTNIHGRWCAARFSVTNRALLSQLVAPPSPFTNAIVLDYDADTDPGAPFRLLSTNGLAVFAPPMFGN